MRVREWYGKGFHIDKKASTPLHSFKLGILQRIKVGKIKLIVKYATSLEQDKNWALLSLVKFRKVNKTHTYI